MSGADRTERQLRQALYRFACPSPHTLGEYHLDLLPAEERSRIAAHALACPHCTDELHTLRSFLSVPSVAPAAIEGPVAQLKRVVATLFVPPSPAAAAAGLRGILDDAIQTYRVEGLTITVGPGPDSRRARASLMGMIVPEASTAEDEPDFAGAEAHLTSTDAPAHTSPIDELGNFAFDDVTPGTYSLQLRLANLLIVVERLTLGETA